ncbi:MAG: fructose-bisphosphate aldolase, partial [Arcicella sp.]|nr:fructose-bisphosphate aldolase [Arcicella sp.]
KTNPEMYTKLSSNNPIDLCRYQVVNCYSGRINLINSGGESTGKTDLTNAVKTAVINKRAGGAGLIMGRKAFQRPFNEGVELINAVQEIYLSNEITIA